MQDDELSLEHFFTVQDENLAITRKLQKPLYDRVIAIDTLFAKVATSLDRSPEILSALFLFRAHSAFRGAARLGLSAQVIECYPLLRSVLEAAVYGLVVSRDAKKAEVWTNRHESDQAQAQCRQSFRIGELLETVDGIDARTGALVRTLYDTTIDYGAHPNERSILGVAKRTEDEEMITFSLQYLTNTPIMMAATLKVMCQVGVVALGVFNNIWEHRWKILGVPGELRRLRRGL